MPPAFLTLSEASRRSGRSPGHLARQCRSTWAASGLARIQSPADGGKPAWFVREDADESLSRVKNVERLNDDFDMNGLLNEAQRAIVIFRERAIERFEKCRGDEVELLVMELSRGGERVSRGSLYRWRAAYRLHGRRGLCDGRWGIREDGEGGDGPGRYADFFNELESWWLDQNEPSMASAYKLACRVAGRNGWDVPSARTAQRHLARLPAGRRVRGRKGHEAMVNTIGAFIIRDYTRIVVEGVERPMLSNDIWCGDHHICDTMVQFEGKLVRPWLTAWEDLRSRKIIGYRFSPHAPDSSSVLLALRSGIMSNGLCVPRFCYTDNGKDFDAWMLQGFTKWERRRLRITHDMPLFNGVYGVLQIGCWHAQPFNAKAKPVERWFGTYEQQFGKLTRTYCGRSPQHKPAHLEERLKRGEAPPYEDYVADASAFIEQYHAAPHSGQGMDGLSPNEIYRAQLAEVRTTTAEALEICLLKTSRPVTVGRNGVTFEGRIYGQGDPALRAWSGRKVQLYVDPEDIRRVAIWTLDQRKICDAQAAELMPFGAMKESRFKDAMNRVQKHNRALAEVRKRGMRMVRSPIEILLDDEREKRMTITASEPPTPPTITPIRTGFERAAKADQPMRILRPAVGAENIDLLAAADEFAEEFAEDRPSFDLMSIGGIGGDE